MNQSRRDKMKLKHSEYVGKYINLYQLREMLIDMDHTLSWIWHTDDESWEETLHLLEVDTIHENDRAKVIINTLNVSRIYNYLKVGEINVSQF